MRQFQKQKNGLKTIFYVVLNSEQPDKDFTNIRRLSEGFAKTSEGPIETGDHMPPMMQATFTVPTDKENDFEKILNEPF